MNVESEAPATFRGLDPDLPSIAALAAAEIDALIRRQQTSFTNVDRLAIVLSESFSQAGQQIGTRRLLDPVSTTVFAKTIVASCKKPLQSYNDLADITVSLAQQMNRISEVENDSLLATMKDFCLALSRYALASKGRVDSVTPSPVFQR